MRFLEVCDSKNTFHNPRLFQAFLKMFWLGKKKKITWKIKILASLCKTGSYIFFRGSWYSGWSLVSQLDCPTLCDPMDCSMPGFPVHHQLPEHPQTHAHWVSDAIHPSHPLLSPPPPAFNLSQDQGLFQWISSLHQVAKVSEFQFQHQSFQWIFRTDFL